jgi:protein-S-isoprenylcysteine O-methyltransferase Ste14
MDASTVGAIKDAMNPLVAKLGELGTAGFALAVKQVAIDGAAQMIGGWLMVAVVVVILGFTAYMFNMHLKAKDRNYYDGGWFMGVIVGAACAGMLSVATYFTFWTAYAMSVNPEWYAIAKLAALVVPHSN